MADVELSELTTLTTAGGVVEDEMQAAPARTEDRARLVKCCGDGLCFLYVDIPSDVVVDTRQAGPGQRLVTVLLDVSPTGRFPTGLSPTGIFPRQDFPREQRGN